MESSTITFVDVPIRPHAHTETKRNDACPHRATRSSSTGAKEGGTEEGRRHHDANWAALSFSFFCVCFFSSCRRRVVSKVQMRSLCQLCGRTASEWAFLMLQVNGMVLYQIIPVELEESNQIILTPH